MDVCYCSLVVPLPLARLFVCGLFAACGCVISAMCLFADLSFTWHMHLFITQYMRALYLLSSNWPDWLLCSACGDRTWSHGDYVLRMEWNYNRHVINFILYTSAYTAVVLVVLCVCVVCGRTAAARAYSSADGQPKVQSKTNWIIVWLCDSASAQCRLRLHQNEVTLCGITHLQLRNN